MDFVVVIHVAEEGGCWAEVPALPGCFGQGESIGEARAAISAHLAALEEDGHPVSDSTPVVIATVSVPAS